MVYHGIFLNLHVFLLRLFVLFCFFVPKSLKGFVVAAAAVIVLFLIFFKPLIYSGGQFYSSFKTMIHELLLYVLLKSGVEP